MKKLFFVFLFATMITGCGGSEKTTTVCKGNIDELTTNTTTIESSDDQVEIMRAEVVYDVTDYVTDTFPIEYWESQLKSINVDYDSLDGVTAKWDVDDTIITLNVEIDYTKADFDQLGDAGVITTSGGEDEITYISLEQTIKEQENAGLTCKEQ